MGDDHRVGGRRADTDGIDTQIRLCEVDATTEVANVVLHPSNEVVHANHELVPLLLSSFSPDLRRGLLYDGFVHTADESLQRLQRVAHDAKGNRAVIELGGVYCEVLISILGLLDLKEVYCQGGQAAYGAGVDSQGSRFLVVWSLLRPWRRRVLAHGHDDLGRSFCAEEAIDSLQSFWLKQHLFHLDLVKLEDIGDPADQVPMTGEERHELQSIFYSVIGTMLTS